MNAGVLGYYKLMGSVAVPDRLLELYPFQYGFSVRKRLSSDLTYPSLQIQRPSDTALIEVTLSPVDDWVSVLPGVVDFLDGEVGRVTRVYCPRTGLFFSSSGGTTSPIIINSDGTLVTDSNGNVQFIFTSNTTLTMPSSGSLFSGLYSGGGSGATTVTLSESSANGMLLSNRTGGGSQQGIDLEYRSTSTMRFFGKSNDNTTEFFEPTTFSKDTVHKLFTIWQPNVNTSGQRTIIDLNGVVSSSTTTGVEPTPSADASVMGWGISGNTGGSRMAGFGGDFIYYLGNQNTNKAGILTELNFI